MFSVQFKLQLIFLFSWWIHPPGDQEIFSWWGTTLFLIHQETRRFSWSPGGFKNIVPHQEKISLSPGELIHQETKRIAQSPGGLKKRVVLHQETQRISWSPGGSIHQETRRFSPGGVPHIYFNQPGDQEILLSSWWINSPGDKEIFSLWGTIPFFNPLGDQEILLVSWWINSPGDKEIFSWWGVILF